MERRASYTCHPQDNTALTLSAASAAPATQADAKKTNKHGTDGDSDSYVHHELNDAPSFSFNLHQMPMGMLASATLDPHWRTRQLGHDANGCNMPHKLIELRSFDKK